MPCSSLLVGEGWTNEGRLLQFSVVLLFSFELLFPAQDAGLIGFGFGFRNHSFFLEKDGKAGVAQNIFRVVRRNHPGYRDGLIQPPHVLIDSREAMHGIGKSGIKFKGFLIFFDGQFILIVTEMIQRPIIVVFRTVLRLFRHREILASPRVSGTIDRVYS